MERSLRLRLNEAERVLCNQKLEQLQTLLERRTATALNRKQEQLVIAAVEIAPTRFTAYGVKQLDSRTLCIEQRAALARLEDCAPPCRHRCAAQAGPGSLRCSYPRFNSHAVEQRHQSHHRSMALMLSLRRSWAASASAAACFALWSGLINAEPSPAGALLFDGDAGGPAPQAVMAVARSPAAAIEMWIRIGAETSEID